MQRLEIKNLGPIQSEEKLVLEIKDYLIFIGPQASGKSTISKVIYFFKSLRDDLIDLISEEVEKDKPSISIGAYKKIIRRKFIDFFGPTFHLKNLYICYYYTDNVWIEITLEEEEGKKYVKPVVSEEFEDAFKKKLARVVRNFQKQNSSDNDVSFVREWLGLKKQFSSKLKSFVNELFGEDKELLFIPAGRSVLTTLSDQLQNVHPNYIDEVMRNFIEWINHIKPLFKKSLEDLALDKEKLSFNKINFENVNFVKKMIQKILKGKYQFDEDGEKIYFDNDRYVKINFSSSGQQESIWILLIIFLFVLEKKGVFLVIEEPEAHLYPETQKDIIDLITFLSNIEHNQVVITTHSPYILSSVSNLIYAGKVGKHHPDEVAPRIDPSLWIPMEQVGAYFINKGECRDILDRKLGAIEVEAVDSASKIINDDDDFLFELDDES